ncbi:MAG TPA: acetyl-CoA carboxylase biotin carboxyl carrier protein subunit [Melioribacteraceae bacterium]|nr:acetyl-CoA carboxylase biotin carboxyl carrier protein subunit [Melioribacteraceae bacterium]
MNDYVVTLDDKKVNITIIDNSTLKIEGSLVKYEISKVSDFLYLLNIDNKVYSITTNRLNSEKYSVLIDGHYYEPLVRTQLMEKATEFLSLKEKQVHHLLFKAPMPGLIIKLKKAIGERVELGESLLVLEAMKMENDLKSPASGIIKEVFVLENTPVEKDQKILLIE